MKSKKFIIEMLLIICVLPVHAQQIPDAKTESFYSRYLTVFRNNKSTRKEVRNALPLLDSAIKIQPQVFKYSYAKGAGYKYLNDFDQAKTWYARARSLTNDESQLKNIDNAVDKCDWEIRKRAAQKRNSSDPGIVISFIMKEQGTHELSNAAVENFPSILPAIPIEQDPVKILEVFRSRISPLDYYKNQEFLVMSLNNNRTAEEHFQKGIISFYDYYQKTFSFEKPKTYVTILLSENPMDLVEATNKLYPSVDLNPNTPFLGYYNPKDNFIAANGGMFGYGTLLHELIHAFINADFPDAPMWLNEGLAMLYERTLWSGNQLKGLPNWRFDHLDSNKFHNLEDLIKMISLRDYDLAQIRMLMLAIDDKSKIGQFYNYIKTNKNSYNLLEWLNQIGISSIKWREFVENTLAEYKTELLASKDEFSNPFEVKFIQAALNLILGKNLKIDGFWGENSQNALIEFQKRMNLVPDGLFGSATRDLLTREYDKVLVK